MPEAKDPMMSPNTLDDTNPIDPDIPDKGKPFSTEPAEQEHKPPQAPSDASNTTPKQ